MELLTLMNPSVKFESEYRSLVDEIYAIDGLFIRRPEGDFAEFVRTLKNESLGRDLPEGRIQQSTFWLIRNDTRLVGASRLRHVLTPTLEEWGGHIGYNIRPAEWGKGYGTQLLALTLKHARALNLPRVLLMCQEDNIGSKRVIEKNGGTLAEKAISPDDGKPYLKYWIDL